MVATNEKRAQAELDEFQGRVALVTGGAGDGIGRAIANLLARRGAAVVIADVHSRRLENAVEELTDNSEKTVKGYELDVADRGAINEVLADIASTVGPVQVLVNSVGRTTIGDILDYPAEEFERLLSVNLTSPWYLTMGAVRHMREAGGGAIVNISSIAPPVGFAMIEPPYAAAKAGLHAITRGFANAAGVFGIRCNTVAMGMVAETHFARTHPELMPDLQTIPLRRHTLPSDIAEAVSFLASDRASFITGELLTVGGGANFGI